MKKNQELSQKTVRSSFLRKQVADSGTPLSGKKKKSSEKTLSAKLRRPRRKVNSSEVKREKVFPAFLTEQEIEEAKCYLGVFLPPDCRKRYEKIYRQKVEARRVELETDEWKKARYPK